MFEIKWKRLNAESDYYEHGKFMFKRRKIKGYYVYHIYEGSYLHFNTDSEWTFLSKAQYIVQDGHYPTQFNNIR